MALWGAAPGVAGGGRGVPGGRRTEGRAGGGAGRGRGVRLPRPFSPRRTRQLRPCRPALPQSLQADGWSERVPLLLPPPAPLPGGQEGSQGPAPRGHLRPLCPGGGGHGPARACCLEMRMLVELGLGRWASAPTLLTWSSCCSWCTGHPGRGPANPTVSLQRFLLAEASLPSTLLELVAQALGVQAAAGALTRPLLGLGAQRAGTCCRASWTRTAARRCARPRPHGALCSRAPAPSCCTWRSSAPGGSRAVHRAPLPWPCCSPPAGHR